MASSGSSSKSLIQSAVQTFKRFFRKPWEITGPCSHPEYRNAVPRANEYRRFCPATPNALPVIPTANPENVYDIKYFNRDRRRDLPPKRVTIYRKEDALKQMREKKTFDVTEFPRVFLTARMVQEQDSLPDGGYQK
ncbi:uncharacterized protein LOC116258078 [Nymphaea colorata]|uniref:Uncharacterized protein n=1 Tax=Nymphaea colorata TaxID=210225 RepID=A0A5K1F149_9MAGN|nr:uncharacterized protein LOC116258078 [Nymphaea colorata]VVW56310.1 unnamed protein product [Nymphaea colorata]